LQQNNLQKDGLLGAEALGTGGHGLRRNHCLRGRSGVAIFACSGMAGFSFSFGRSSRSSRGRNPGSGAMLFGGVMFTVIGLAVTVGLGVMVYNVADTYRWDEVPATLEHAEVVVREGGPRHDRPFQLDVRYRYQFDGKEFTGGRDTLDDGYERDYENLALRRAELLADDSLVVYVNPNDPGEAILRRTTLWIAFVILFPLVFVGVGIGFLVAGVRGMRRRKAEAGGEVGGRLESLGRSATGSGRMGKLSLAGFFMIFLGAGIGVSFPIAIIPWQQAREAENWVEAEAEVIWSRVTTHRSDDSTTYGIDIFYRYVVDGIEYRSNRYDFSTGTSSGRQSKQRVVDRFPAGETFMCFVDPDQPERAVIDRDAAGIGWFALLPLVFILVGGGGVAGCLVSFVRAGRLKGDGNAVREAVVPEVHFKAGRKRLMKLGGIMAMAVIWNGIVSAMYFLPEEGEGPPIWFIGIFAAVGLVLIGAFLHSLLGLINPRTDLTVRPGKPRLGESFELIWKTRGSSGRLKEVTIAIEAVEKASYRRGTRQVTDEAVLFRHVLATPEIRIELHQGRVEFALPVDLVGSWKATNNEIVWQIRVKGKVVPGPDVSETYNLTVLPYWQA